MSTGHITESGVERFDHLLGKGRGSDRPEQPVPDSTPTPGNDYSALALIRTKAQLQSLAAELGMRADWHSPSEMDVDASVHGDHFDNAMGAGDGLTHRPDCDYPELNVVLHRDGTPVAAVNLADLLAFACH